MEEKQETYAPRTVAQTGSTEIQFHPMDVLPHLKSVLTEVRQHYSEQKVLRHVDVQNEISKRQEGRINVGVISNIKRETC